MYGPCFSSIVGGHPLRSPTRHRLGEPLPHQLADGTQVPPGAPFGFLLTSLTSKNSCGISRPFGLLSPSPGQVTNALLTRSPLSLRIVRLACIRHAASVHPEPGSNSPHYVGKLTLLSVQVLKLIVSFFSGFLITLQLLRCFRFTFPDATRQKSDAFSSLIQHRLSSVTPPWVRFPCSLVIDLPFG